MLRVKHEPPSYQALIERLALVVVGVPTEDERKIIYPPDGVARFPAAFEYKVTTD